MTEIEGLRARVQALLLKHDFMSANELLVALKLNKGWYWTLNRALNSPPNLALGETPIARTHSEGRSADRWVYYAVTPTNPLTYEVFQIRTKGVRTSLAKTRSQILEPAIAAGAVALGQEGLMQALGKLLDSSIQSLDLAFEVMRGQAKVEQAKVETQENLAQIEREQADLDARRARLETAQKAMAKKAAGAGAGPRRRSTVK